MPATHVKNTHRTFITVFSSIHCGRITDTVAALARPIAVTQHLKYTGNTSQPEVNQVKMKLSSSKERIHLTIFFSGVGIGGGPSKNTPPDVSLLEVTLLELETQTKYLELSCK